jgi:hypothetical protein
VIHPALDLTVPPRIAAAVLAALRADADLMAYAAGRIDDYEAEAFASGVEADVSADVAAPSIGVVLFDVAEERSATARQNTLITTLALPLLTESRKARGTDDHLRQRVVDRMRRVVAVDGGRLVDPLGEPLTEALLQFTRVGTPVRVGTTHLITLSRVVFTSTIREETRELI